IALLQETLRYSSDGGHAAGKDVSRAPAFKRRQVVLQPRARRIGDASVLIALVFSQLFLHIRGCGEDGHCDRARGGIRLLPGVNGLRRETLFLLLLHIPPSKMFLDKYRSAASGMMVTTRLPAPSRLAT